MSLTIPWKKCINPDRNIKREARQKVIKISSQRHFVRSGLNSSFSPIITFPYYISSSTYKKYGTGGMFFMYVNSIESCFISVKNVNSLMIISEICLSSPKIIVSFMRWESVFLYVSKLFFISVSRKYFFVLFLFLFPIDLLNVGYCGFMYCYYSLLVRLFLLYYK